MQTNGRTWLAAAVEVETVVSAPEVTDTDGEGESTGWQEGGIRVGGLIGVA